MEDSKVAMILEAARNRFAHYGLSKTTMNEIAHDIGMSKASLYYYFTDKEKIFIAVIEEDISEFVGVIEALIARPNKASYKLKKYITTRNQFLMRLLNLAKFDSANVTGIFNPVYDDLKANFFQTEKQLIQRILLLGIQQGEFVKFNAETYADLFLSAMIGLRATALASTPDARPEYEKVEEKTGLFVDLFLKSIRFTD